MPSWWMSWDPFTRRRSSWLCQRKLYSKKERICLGWKRGICWCSGVRCFMLEVFGWMLLQNLWRRWFSTSTTSVWPWRTTRRLGWKCCKGRNYHDSQEFLILGDFNIHETPSSTRTAGKKLFFLGDFNRLPTPFAYRGLFWNRLNFFDFFRRMQRNFGRALTPISQQTVIWQAFSGMPRTGNLIDLDSMFMESFPKNFFFGSLSRKLVCKNLEGDLDCVSPKELASAVSSFTEESSLSHFPFENIQGGKNLCILEA